MRRLVVLLFGLALCSCNDVTGNERGGTIAGVPNNFGLTIEGIFMSNEDALRKTNEHCRMYGKQARITAVTGGKTLFACS